MGKLEGKVAIITGGGEGIGRGIALEFAREGADVAICGRTLETLEAVRQEITALSRKAKTCVVDVSKVAQIKVMVDEVLLEFGKIDILVNNAAVDTRPSSILDITEEQWDYVVDVNLKGVFFCSQLVIPYMVKRQYGRIVNISSIGGRAGGNIKHAHYVSAKAGVQLLTKSFAQEFAPQGVITNAIAPGFIIPGMPTRGRTQKEIDTLVERFSKVAAVSRVGTPEDIAKVAVFLASEDSSFICGQTIPVDGGRMNRM